MNKRQRDGIHFGLSFLPDQASQNNWWQIETIEFGSEDIFIVHLVSWTINLPEDTKTGMYYIEDNLWLNVSFKNELQTRCYLEIYGTIQEISDLILKYNLGIKDETFKKQIEQKEKELNIWENIEAVLKLG